MIAKPRLIAVGLLLASACVLVAVFWRSEKHTLDSKQIASPLPPVPDNANVAEVSRDEREKISTEYKKQILDLFTEYDMLVGKIREDIGDKDNEDEIINDKKRSSELTKKTSELNLLPSFKESHLLFSRSLLVLTQSLDELDYDKLDESARLKEEALAKFWELSK